MNDTTTPTPTDAPGIVSANLATTTGKDDPLVEAWFKKIKDAEKHWGKFHRRVRHNRKVVRGIDDAAEPESAQYNKHRANLIQSTISVVLSKVYAKNPQMSGAPTNKARDLALFCETVSTVTQTMLEDAGLKQKAKRTVRAAMTCSFGIVKVQYQRDIRTDPVIKQRIQDAQDNIVKIEGLIAQIEDKTQCADMEAKRRELEQAIKALEAQKETVAAEGLVMDRVRTDRLLVDPAIEDIWDYCEADWMGEKIPMRKSAALGMFPDLARVEGKSSELDNATTYKVGEVDKDANKDRPYSANIQASTHDDPMILVYEVWNKADNTIYTLVDGVKCRFARAPYQPQYAGERWWPYFLLPFASTDGEFVSQSLVDVLEKLQVEHNETRDKFAEHRKNIRPHLIVSADVSDKQITRRLHPEIGEIVVIDTGGQPLKDYMAEGTQLRIDPAVYDTTPIQNDWETVSGLQDAARSIVTTPKTATEASISDQSLAARVAEFRDQIEDWLTEIAQYSSELCLLAMTPQQVEQIMGAPEPAEPLDPQAALMAVASGQPMPAPEPPAPTYNWPEQRTPESVFSLIQMKIRAGSTAAPNKLAMQEAWTKAMPLIREMVMLIRQIDATGGDSTPERELVKETAARFDETLDVERFLPAKPVPVAAPAMPQIPGAQPGMPLPGGLPGMPPAPMQ